MLKIVEADNEKTCRSLNHGPEVFHHALRAVLNGEYRFHVKNDRGEDYDLEYRENNSLIPPGPTTEGKTLLPPYFMYDEYKKEALYLEMFAPYSGVIFEELNEYSVVLTGIILRYTDKEVYIPDKRIYWFAESDERLHVTEDLPDYRRIHAIYSGRTVSVGYGGGNPDSISPTPLFHNVFLWQWLTDLPTDQVKYAEVAIGHIAGVGSVLAQYTRMNNAFSKLGWKVILKQETTRFKDEMLEKYFNLDICCEDSDETNTVYIPNTIPAVISRFVSSSSCEFDESILNPSFAKELNEYKDAVIGNKHMLGALIRGTDYITTKMTGERKMATVDDMLPMLREWMEKDGYDAIFLATEDQDILDRMVKEFPGKIRVISQERRRVSDFKNTVTIAGIEKEEGAEKDYDAILEDDTVNYFYALYMLSKCDSFMCSGQCNGWDVVRSFRGDGFRRCYKFQVGVQKSAAWPMVRPIYAGLFARAIYPEERTFYMTFEFELKEAVDVSVLKSAWEKTCAVYPMLTYAVAKCEHRYCFTEDKLDFVFRETTERIEPTQDASNYHSTAFGYQGNILHIYIDHTIMDGTGCKFVLETLFYYYYCEADHQTYPVPDGVHTLEEGTVDGLEMDAFKMVTPIDPQAMMNQKPKEDPIFLLPETDWSKPWYPLDECSGYMVSVPGDEFMAYAKSIKGSPMSLLALLLAQSVERLHPENSSPVAVWIPVSTRKIMGTENSLLNQVVHATYRFQTGDLCDDSRNEERNTAFRTYLKGFASEQNIRMMTGIYAGIIEGYQKAIAADMMNVVLEKISKSEANMTVSASYIGTILTGEYGSRIRLNAFHAMGSTGAMVQMAEIGGIFYLCWFGSFDGKEYAADLAEHMRNLGMAHAEYRKTE
ncbi:MAG: hypothetical protein LKM35_00500 [Lachnospiraceae bacterium]|jgi:hypothetical protein|nr:hypothetical protein [Lachnospiraceae bacterium]MCI1726160.1 hypothetical protein [Lachnospiraceae bacterium]